MFCFDRGSRTCKVSMQVDKLCCVYVCLFRGYDDDDGSVAKDVDHEPRAELFRIELMLRYASSQRGPNKRDTERERVSKPRVTECESRRLDRQSTPKIKDAASAAALGPPSLHFFVRAQQNGDMARGTADQARERLRLRCCTMTLRQLLFPLSSLPHCIRFCILFFVTNTR